MFADELTTRLHDTMDERLTNQKERIQQLVQSHALRAVKQKVANNHDKVNYLNDRLQHRKEVHFMRKYERLNGLNHRLELKNPNAPLEQGYTRVWQDDQWIKSMSAFDTDNSITIEWEDGETEVKN
jgi:exodeoxyribonuclease VII large subunit